MALKYLHIIDVIACSITNIIFTARPETVTRGGGSEITGRFAMFIPVIICTGKQVEMERRRQVDAQEGGRGLSVFLPSLN